VTATTVGYGDQFPKTPLGYFIAVLLMMFSLIIAALPVGVIGSNFSEVWDALENQKKDAREVTLQEMKSIKVAMQRFTPFEVMSKLVVIEVWNERFPSTTDEAWGPEGANFSQVMPNSGDFMGQARFELILPPNESVTCEVPLRLQPDDNRVKRIVAGSVLVRYTWTPSKDADSDALLKGKLEVTLVSGKDLIDINCSRPGMVSNPFCLVICYPTCKSMDGDLLVPKIWRTPVQINTLTPRWECSHDFDFNWGSQDVADFACAGSSGSLKPSGTMQLGADSSTGLERVNVKPTDDKDTAADSVLRDAGQPNSTVKAEESLSLLGHSAGQSSAGADAPAPLA